MSKDNPCRNCEERCVGCHGTCQRYLDWHEQHVQRQREIRSKIEAENTMRSFYIESGNKIRKERRSK